MILTNNDERARDEDGSKKSTKFVRHFRQRRIRKIPFSRKILLLSPRRQHLRLHSSSRKQIRKHLVNTLHSLMISIFFVLNKETILSQAYGPSMLPTINLTGDLVLAERISTRFNKVCPGDVVLVRSPVVPRRIVTKRVIGMEGDRVSYVADPKSSDKFETVVVFFSSFLFVVENFLLFFFFFKVY